MKERLKLILGFAFALSFFILMTSRIIFILPKTLVLVFDVVVLIAFIIIGATYVYKKIITSSKDVLSKEKLIELNHELNERDKIKNNFLATVVHDLKSPFNGILTFSNYLLEVENLDDEHHDLVKRINSLTKRQLKYINNVTELLELQLDKLELDLQELSIQGLIRESVNVLKYKAQEKEIDIIKENENDSEIYVDFQVILKIMDILISNAIKYTEPKGTVTIKTFKKNGHEIEIHVIDTGIGFNDEILEYLFSEPRKTKRNGTLGEQGHGLGLQICKQLIEFHGGELYFKKNEPKGSDVYFTLKTDKSILSDYEKS